MIDYLNKRKASQYRIDFTFRIILRSFKPYKLMSIYVIDLKNKILIATGM